MKLWQWVLLCLFAFVIFFVAYAPATLIYRFIPSNANIAIVQPSGTLFNGKMASIGYNGIFLKNFSWQLSPIALFMGKATLDINGGDLRNAQHAYADGQVSVSLLNTSHVSASDLTLMLPIKSILAQMKLPVQITAQGRIRVDLAEADIKQACRQLVGTGNWSNASIALNNQSVSLGDFLAEVSCEEGGFAAQVGGDNKFDLDAKFVLMPNGQLSQSGTFKLDPSLPREMQQAAVFFGNPDPNGRYILR